MATEWQIGRHGEKCVNCAANFRPDQYYRACLFETREPMGFARRDFCLDCPTPQDPTMIGFWRARRTAEGSRKRTPFDKEAILAFFLRLDSGPGPERAQFRFVLALLLWRKKVLRFESSDDGRDGEVWRFRLPRDGTLHEVRKPALGDAELDQLSAQLERLLETGETRSADSLPAGGAALTDAQGPAAAPENVEPAHA